MRDHTRAMMVNFARKTSTGDPREIDFDMAPCKVLCSPCQLGCIIMAHT